MSQIERVTLTILHFSQVVRRSLLLSTFGWVSECKHEPTCSTYAVRAVQECGLVRGVGKSARRILTCL